MAGLLVSPGAAEHTCASCILPKSTCEGVSGYCYPAVLLSLSGAPLGTGAPLVIYTEAQAVLAVVLPSLGSAWPWSPAPHCHGVPLVSSSGKFSASIRKPCHGSVCLSLLLPAVSPHGTWPHFLSVSLLCQHC